MKINFPKTSNFTLSVLLTVLTCSPAMAGPEGGEVIRGTGTIERHGELTQINQGTARIAINWQTFDVASNETVRFVQPDSSSVALNQILDQNPSTILGVIDANGHVFLINPNGIVFGEGAQVNVAGLIASTLNISTEDFMAGNYTFDAGETGGMVLNQGTIRASGFVALLGEAVANEGLIVAEAGTIALASGDSIALDFDGSGLMYFEVQSEVLESALGQDDAVRNSGTLVADGGKVLLTSSAANDVFTNAINNDGVIQARRIDNQGGVIRLAGGSGTTINTGDLNASGDANSDGGSIQVTGNFVGLAGDSTINADGGRNGGQILIGGGYQGNDADVQNANRTFVGSGVSLSADAGTVGNGGEVVVWSDDVTRYYGSISATGGSVNGDGGNAEVSGANNLRFEGYADLSAANGANGTLLLDPATLTILGGDGGDPGVGTVGDLDGSLTADNTITFGESNGDDAVTADALESLNADILLQASNSIVVEDQTILRFDTGLAADGSIDLQNDVSITLQTRNSNALGDGAGTISFVNATDSIVTSGTGAITIDAGTVGTDGAAITNLGILTTAGGAVTLTAAGDISVAADITSNDGDVSITADDSVTIASGATIAAGAGAVTVRVDNANDSADTLAVLGNIASSTSVTLVGSSTNANDVLQGSDSGNAWTTDAANTGTLNNWDFNDFAVLQGGAGVDIFSVTTADFGGDLNGGGDDDVFTIDTDLTGNVNGEAGNDIVNLNASVIGGVDGGDDNDIVNLSDGETVSGTLTGGAGGTNNDTLAAVGGGSGNLWTMAATNNIDTQAFSGFENLAGDAAANDTFVFTGAGAVAGNVTGGAGGTDTLDVSAATGTVTVNLQTNTANPIGGTFGGIEALTGDNVNDILVGPNGGATITTTAAQVNDGTVAGIAFTNFANLTGGTGNDLINLNGNVTGTVDGGAGNDTVTLANGVTVGTLTGGGNGATGDTLAATGGAGNTWTIGATNNLNAQVFSGFENLAGDAAVNDAFVFNGAGTVAGNVTGGAGGTDTLDVSGANGTVTVNLQASTANPIGGTFGGIEALTGDNVNDVLVGPDGGATITTTAAQVNDGTVAGIAFTNFANLTGGTGNDTFNLNGNVTGTVDGGAGGDTINVNVAMTADIFGGVGNDTINLTANVGGDVDGGASNDTINLTAGVTVGGILTGGTGGADNDTLAAIEVTTGVNPNTWQINAGELGTVDLEGTGVQAFSDFENFNGNGNVDNFTFDGAIAGTASGQGADDTFTLNDGFASGAIDGGNGTDTASYLGRSGAVDITVADYNSIEALIGSNFNDTLRGTNGADTFTVNADNAGTVPTSNVNFSSFEILNGQGGDDTFNIGADVSVGVSGGTGNDTINLTASVSGDVDSGDDDDTINLSDGVTVGGTLSGGVGGSDTLAAVGGGAGNTWTMAATNNIDGQTFSGFENLAGDAAANDTFVFTGAGAVSGNVSGGAGGTDTLDVSGADGTVTVNLQAGTANPIGGTFSGIEAVTGDNAADVLVGPNGGATFATTTQNDGTVAGVAFTNFANLTGGTGDDTFNLGGDVTGVVAGGAGADTVNVTAALTGTIAGGAGNDTINLAANVGGDVDSGDDDDTINLSDGVTVGGTLSGAAGNDTLAAVGGGAGNTWTMGAANNIDGQTFSGIENLAGDAAANDTFVFTGAGAVSGNVSGGAGGTDRLDVSGANGTVTVNLQASTANPIGGTFSGIEAVTGDNAADVLVGPNGGATFATTTQNDGTVAGVAFTNFANLTGGTGNDTFNLGGDVTGVVAGGAGADTVNVNAAVSGDIAGGAGNDTINLAANVGADVDSGDDDDTINLSDGVTVGGTLSGGAGNDTLAAVGGGAGNTWTMGAANNIDGQTFSGIENLAGDAAANDTFVFTGAGAVSGNVSGGAGGTDTLDVSTADGTVTINLANNTATPIGGTFSEIEAVTGDNAADVLVGPDGGATFATTTQNDGTVAGVAFTNFANLTGGTGDDTFNVGADVTGNIDAGAGNDTINLAGGVVGNIDGNAGDDSIFGSAGSVNNFSVTDADEGVANGSNFTGVENLTGGTAADNFTFSSNLTGTASGGAGNDTFNINTGGSAGVIDGGAGTDTQTYAGQSGGVTIEVNDSASRSGIEVLVGSSFVDAFEFAGSVANGISVDGGGGADTFEVTGDSDVAGDLVVGNVSQMTIGANLDASNMTFTVDGSISQTAGSGMITAGVLNSTSNGDQTYDLVDVDRYDATTNGGDASLTNAASGGDLTIGSVNACNGTDCTNSNDGSVNITTLGGDILGVPGLDHIMGRSANIVSAFGIGAFNNPLRFVDMPTTGTPIRLSFTTVGYIDAGSSPVDETANLFNLPAIAGVVAAAQAAGREEDEEVDWAAYSEDITVYEINNEGIQLPEEQQVDEFAKSNGEGALVPIAQNNGQR